jgi:hypothetical protein
MKISFENKEESNVRREKEFLKLSKSERVLSFFKLSLLILKFPTKSENSNKNNLILTLENKTNGKGIGRSSWI